MRNLQIGSIKRQVAVFDIHMLKKAVEKIVQNNNRNLVFPKKIMDFIASLLWNLLFSKPCEIRKPPSNRKTTGLAYFDTNSLKLTSHKKGEKMIGNKAVIELGIASDNQ